MPNTVTKRILNDGARNFVTHVHVNSDGTEETALKLYEASDANPAFTSARLHKIDFAMAGNFQAVLSWEGTPNRPIMTLGNDQSGRHDLSDRSEVNDLPAGATGNIVLETTGIAANDEIDIVLYLKKRDILT